jgi:hypothetical protein
MLQHEKTIYNKKQVLLVKLFNSLVKRVISIFTTSTVLNHKMLNRFAPK